MFKIDKIMQKFKYYPNSTTVSTLESLVVFTNLICMATWECLRQAPKAFQRCRNSNNYFKLYNRPILTIFSAQTLQ